MNKRIRLPRKQLHITPARALIEQVVPVENSEDTAFSKKPKRGTGFWTSTWREERKTSAWVDWCVGNDFCGPYTQQWLLLTPQAEVRLYVVDSETDLHTLLLQFGWETERLRKLNADFEASFGASDFSSLFMLPRLPWYSVAHHERYIDFERLAKAYDGIWLTERGNASTHLSAPYDLNGWDSESILWFRWRFTQVERIDPPARIQEAQAS